MQPRYFVHDKSRLCRVVMGDANVQEALKDGFREVSPEEQDAFQQESRRLYPKGFKGK